MRRFITPPPWQPLVLLTTLLALAGGCKKDDPEPISTLPPATQTGANTFGCLLNGEAWLPGGYRNMGGQERKFTVYYPNKGQFKGEFTLTGRRVGTGYNEEIQLALNAVDHAGTYLINVEAVPYPSALPWLDQGVYRTYKPTTREYITSSKRTGSLTITRLDTVAHVIAGTFSFTAEELGGTSTVNVTDGRFDINYLNN